jgi:hypothetical protein
MGLRGSPGPLLDGRALEGVAREAAAVELYLEEVVAQEYATDIDEALRRTLLGTTARPTSHAGTIKIGGAVVISLSSGMLSLLDALTIGTMTAHPPAHVHEDGFYRTMLTDADVREHLDACPEAVDVVVDFFLSWLRDGKTPEADHSLVREEHSGLAKLARGHAHRFVVAHEYCHALVDKLKLAPWGDDATAGDAYAAEIRADMFALRVLGRSSTTLDNVPANVGMMGAVLAMKSHELLDQALATVSTSGVALPVAHPPFSVRARMCVESYRWFVQDTSDPLQRADGLIVLARIADHIWERAFPRIKELLSSTTLHPIWRSPL